MRTMIVTQSYIEGVKYLYDGRTEDLTERRVDEDSVLGEQGVVH